MNILRALPARRSCPANPFDTAAGHKQVWLLAGPLILSNISVPLVGIVRYRGWSGRLGNADAIGAIALGGLIFSFLYWGLGFLRMGTTGLIARAVGANDAAEIRHTLLRALLLALCLAGVILLLHDPIIRFALFCLQADSSIESQTRVYASIRIFSAPATLCLYVFTGLFIGRHQAGLALLLQLILNLTNIVLDLVFVVGPGVCRRRRRLGLADCRIPGRSGRVFPAAPAAAHRFGRRLAGRFSIAARCSR